ncbi:MAG: Rieske 2Fe-2S domain-containing protein [Chloroflexota bacterium]
MINSQTLSSNGRAILNERHFTEINGQNPAKRNLSRREFMTYAVGAAAALMTVEAGYVTYAFLMPRFRAGEFGGLFDLGSLTDLPPIGAEPKPIHDGKFWLINTEDGPRALYMVCTHLGCLYKWQPSRHLFECPCHGSNFDREGNLVQGPANRSLDQFVVNIEGDRVSVDTGNKIRGEAGAENGGVA